MAYGDHYALKSPTQLGIKSKLLLNRRLVGHLRRHFAKSGILRILEIGAGHGFFARACTDAGHDFVGVEPHPAMRSLLVEKKYTVAQASCPPIPFDSEQFDVVYAAYVLEYLDGPKTAFEFIRECKRALKPGGVLGIVSSDYVRMGKDFWNASYIASFVTTDRRLRELYFDNGLEHCETVFFAGNLFGPSRHLAYLFYKLYRSSFWSARQARTGSLDSRLFKLRFTFPEGFLAIARKEAATP